MSFTVKELFYTLQGEGAQSGRAAVFCRFTGCNLWSGRDRDRDRAACPFCDTDFVGTDGPGGGEYPNEGVLAAAARKAWLAPWPRAGRPLLVCTGGEPTLQLTAAAVLAFQEAGFEVAIETNGTRPVPPGLDWVTVSPKAGAVLEVRSGDEMKLVFPQAGLDPEELADLPFRHFFLQPMDGDDRERNTARAAAYCLEHPKWRLSLQIHKIAHLP